MQPTDIFFLLLAMGATMPVESGIACRSDDQFTPVRDLISKQIAEKKIPSMAVAVASGGKVVWEEAFGLSDKEKGTKATPDTVYSLASISKPITATALMVLKERGKIVLDRPINDYLGDAKVTARVGDAAQATVLRVANHTSGLPLHWHFFEEGMSKPPKRDETIRRYGILVTAPGEKYIYSNLGYGVLDHVIAIVSGKTYADFLEKEVFKPLGMKHASAGITQGLKEFAAPRYTALAERIPMYHFDHPGASEVYCSAHDLIRFAMFHLKDHLKDQKAILTDDSIVAMQTPAATRGAGSEYGIGWAVGRRIPGYKRVEHAGGMPGVSTELLLFPNQDIAIVVLCNTRSEVVDEVTDKIESILLPDYHAQRVELIRRARERDGAAPKPSNRQATKLRGEWRGEVFTYQGNLPFLLSSDESGIPQIRLGSEKARSMSNVKFDGKNLSGEFEGMLGTDDTLKSVCNIVLEMRLLGDVLSGSATAISQSDGPSGFALTHWVELRKVK